MSTKKKALIIGITGQDGSYLAELLLEKGYEVHGLVRQVTLESSNQTFWRIAHIKKNIHLHSGSIDSYVSIFNLVEGIKPDECYHLAAHSFVSYSFDDEFAAVSANVNGIMHILSAIHQRAPNCRFYFAGSSEMFGQVSKSPQDENTHFHPRSPYGISKVAGFHFTQNYRESHNMYACCGFMFNHESPRRGLEFVTRKITNGVARIASGLQTELSLGNLDSQRDWGFAKDYVIAMWLMLQQEKPEDYVIGTGENHSVRDFIEASFLCLDVQLSWHNSGVDEYALVTNIGPKSGSHIRIGDNVVSIDPVYFRKGEVNLLTANASKAAKSLNWHPQVKFKSLVKMMIEADLEICRGTHIRE